ncbi:expansin EXLX1 family cellulose-binding protein [Nonomuraea soli]|uniref:Expansin (Peptidoglycan-binding protein) n=1 Tax=Nonomuraea soli TaxID=1032476 RepID=A0A7W0CLL2_9ACTN|nr:expansin EXLX1 family cellulose-binding protein [Nonomuraea soli]MBA2893341.1 expansin (peptidoglycan-binding protein) [Nonomuraea soli]
MTGLSLVTAVSVTLFAIHQDSACADPIPAPTRTGKAYLFNMNTGTGNCSLAGAAKGTLFASVSPQEYAGSRACGTFLAVAGPRGIVRVQVVDQCPGCRLGDLDLNQAAFERITDRGKGVESIAYRQIRDPSPAKALSFRVKPGSSTSWAAVQVIDHGNPVKLVELRAGDDWLDLRRGTDNYWVSAKGAGKRFDLRVSDAYGSRRTVHDLELEPGRVQRTKVKLYGTAKRKPEPAVNERPLERPAPLEQPTPVPAPPKPAAAENRCFRAPA